ncbi:Putative thiosulfate sulfurtransferase, mitochondrial [Leucoagaricus sp. SymC.cos]|nr:Putative thiosulfate sulfurtransferase, mitochondrial [Leucoagaricus sp. SymC.cos]
MASITRNSISRNFRSVARHSLAARAVPRLALAQFVRYNSSETPSSSKPPPTPEQIKKKQALERQDDLQRDWDAKILTYEELLPLTQSPTPDTYLIDVREPDEVIQGMIPSAVNLPLTTLADSLHMAPEAFKARHGYDKPRKHQRVIFYCRSGKRSSSASDVAKRNGYRNIQNYKGSWLEWTEKQNLQTPSS